MSRPLFDRHAVRFRPLAERKNKVALPLGAVSPDQPPRVLSPAGAAILEQTSARIRSARAAGRPVICAFGAHTIKNGLGPVLIRLIEEGWITHLATNGAGIIHDWELAFQGKTSENVRENVGRGEFGTWEETGRLINLGLLVGAYRGLGYGESIGRLIEEQGLEIPTAAELEKASARFREDPETAAAAIELLGACRELALAPGWLAVAHPFKEYSAQAAAFRLAVPFTGHPMIGHDIIYTHPLATGAAIGRTAMRDFLAYAEAVSKIEGGVYLSVGSAIMSPMIFEKSLSMAQNLALQRGKSMTSYFILVVDIARSTWDWQKDGEPPADDPAYYQRYLKTFSRMGGTMRYLSADNRDFFPSLLSALRGNKADA
jgi:hypothetical protein